MTFGYPNWVLAAIVLPLGIYLFARWQAKSNAKRFQLFARPLSMAWLVPTHDPRAQHRRVVLFALALGFTAIALARPQWGEREESMKVNGTDIVFALDVSSSMGVEDVIPSRLKRAKNLIREITDGLGGDRVGLVLFAGSSYMACPLTTNSEYFLDIVAGAGPELIANQGTDLAAGIETAFRALERAAEEGSNPNVLSTKSIIVITDGEDHEGQARAVAEKVKAASARIFIVGIGTEKGGPIPVRDETGKLVGYKREGAEIILSRLKIETLSEVARTSGGEVWVASDSGDEVQEILKNVGSLGRSEFAERKFVTKGERFQIPLLIAVALLFLEMLISRTRRLNQAWLSYSSLWVGSLIGGSG